jgi:hypothetical protein
MSDIKQEIIFTDQGLDWDTDLRYMGAGSSPYALNILKGEDGSSGVITNMLGNHLVSYPLSLSDAYICVGSCYDELNRAVYYWLVSQPYDTTTSGDFLYDNRLLRFNEDPETIDTIFIDTHNYMGLHQDYLMKDPFKIGNWLFFNPRISEPKMIDVLMAFNYTNYDAYDATLPYVYGNKVTYFGGLFMAEVAVNTGETPVTHTAKWTRIANSYQDTTDLGGNNPYYDSEFRYAFNVLKHIPVTRPVCIYASDLDKNANNVRGKLFRFSHRYKYFDNSYSRYGAFTDVTLPKYDEYYNGEITSDLDKYNCIDVTIPLHSASLIKEIDVIFQETGGDWKRAHIINRQDIVLLNQSFYTYRFYNTDSAYETIDDTYFSEAYDAVPKLASAQEIINKNILCYGGCTEGFDNIDKNDIDVSLTPEIEEITLPTVPGTTIKDVYGATLPYLITYIYPTGVPPTGFGKRIEIGTWYPGGVIDGTQLIVTMNGETEIHYFATGETATKANTILVISNFISDHFHPYTTTISGDYINVWSPPGSTQFPIITQFLFCTVGATKAEIRKKRGFKTGSWHPFCIYYYDGAMRRCDAQTSKQLDEGTDAWEIYGTTVYVPFFGEYSPAPISTAHKWNINWEVNHLPPFGAKWWRWGYAGNALCSTFVEYTISAIGNIGTSSATEPINTTYIDITPLQTLKNSAELTWNKYPNSIIEAYSWTKGDRIRFITETSGATNTIGHVVEGVYDYEILGENKDLNRLYIQQFGYGAASIGADSIVEIYTPLKSDIATTFWEFGEIMPIIEDSGGVSVHGCGSVGTQNQDTIFNDPVKGKFTAGDVFHILRTPSKPVNVPLPTEGYFHESHWYSDFYTSDDWDKGRIGVETDYGERDLNIIRYSDQYLQNTLINGMSTFHGGNYKELNDLYGSVMRIIEIGDTLKVYQRKKPSSILIGRTEYYDATGNANIQATSERILGSIRYSSTNYGTEFPESITRNNRYVYGFDVYNGVFWRDSANGIFPISGRYVSAEGSDDYKMDAYFKQKAKALLVSGVDHIDVMTTWDERYKNLYVIFRDFTNDDNGDTIVFHEPSNRWICFTEFNQTPALGWNRMLNLDYWIIRGFTAGLGYSFDEDTGFGNFTFGTGGSIETQNPTLTFIVDEDGTTYVIDEDGITYIIED